MTHWRFTLRPPQHQRQILWSWRRLIFFRIVTGERMWVHRYSPDKKNAIHGIETFKIACKWEVWGRKAKTRKVMTVIFWDIHGINLVDLTRRVRTVTAVTIKCCYSALIPLHWARHFAYLCCYCTVMLGVYCLHHHWLAAPLAWDRDPIHFTAPSSLWRRVNKKLLQSLYE